MATFSNNLSGTLVTGTNYSDSIDAGTDSIRGFNTTSTPSIAGYSMLRSRLHSRQFLSPIYIVRV